MTEPDNEPPASTASNASLEPFFESMVRVTLAGFGGSAVGLALQRQQQATPAAKPAARRHGPPSPVRPQPTASLPGQWAISCMFFALILESSRIMSPTGLFLSKLDEEWTPSPMSRALITIGDYTVGGGVAGLAGALARRRDLPTRQGGWMVFGLGAGLALGLVAGVAQAGLDASTTYLEDRDKAVKGASDT